MYSILVQVKLLFFAKSRELSGISNTVISVPTPITGAKLLETVLSLYPRYRAYTGVFMMMNTEQLVCISNLALHSQ